MWDGLLSNSHVASLVKDGPPAAAEGVGLAVHLLRASSTSSAVDASLYSSYPSVLERLLYPTTELVDNDKIILKSPLSLNLEGEKIIGTEEVEIATSGEQKMAHSTPTTAHFSVPEGSDVIDKVLAEALHAEAIAAYQACEDTYIRLDKYAQAVIGGKGSKTYGENLFKWAMVKAFGVEVYLLFCCFHLSGGY